MRDIVFINKEQAVCDSLQVAEKFGKLHKNVLQSIDNLMAENSAVKNMFYATRYKSDNGNYYRKYYMNRDGFSLLVMGFTGKKALEWKIKYIEAFNKMESVLKEKSTDAWLETRNVGKLTRQSEADVLKDLVEYAKEQGSTHADMLYMTYSKLANKMAGVTNREEATIVQLNKLTILENTILCIIRNGIATGMHYKEIYKVCKERLELIKEIAYLDSLPNGGVTHAVQGNR